MAPWHPDNIGGGKIIRAFRTAAGMQMAGTILSREQIIAMAHQNRNALIEKGFLAVWDKAAGTVVGAATMPAPVAEGAERFICSLGFGRYDVVHGVKLNAAPVNREQAHELAGLPPPTVKSEKEPVAN